MKPYIVCHMMTSIDGRIDCEMTEKIGGNEYYTALNALRCDSELSGRVTMQMHCALEVPFVPKNSAPISTFSIHKASQASGYSIAIDTKGVLQWPSNEYANKPLLVITSEQASKEYLKALHDQNISWIAIGKDGIDLVRAMEILSVEFGVKRLAIVGGGYINGACLRANLLDEVSIVLGAGIDGRKGMTAVFDGIEDMSFETVKLKLESVERIGEESVWIRYSL